MRISKLHLLAFLFFIFYSLFAFFYSHDLKIGDIYVTTYDELRYYNSSSNIVSDYYSGNLKDIFSNYYKYSQSIHFMHYYVLAFFRIAFNDSFFIWLNFQIITYIIGCIFFSKIFTLYAYDKKYEIITFILLAVNAPILFYVFSLMRDVQIFLLMTLSIFFYKKNFVIPLFMCLIVLLTYRINAAFSILIYILVDYYLKITSNVRYKFSSMYIVYAAIAVSILFIFNSFSGGSLYSLVSSKLEFIKISDFLFNSIKLLISPLPWSLDESLPSYLKIWYTISFIFTIFIILLLIDKSYKSIVPIPILALVAFNILVYSTEAGIGIRQGAILLPWLVVPSVLYILKFYQKRLS